MNCTPDVRAYSEQVGDVVFVGQRHDGDDGGKVEGDLAGVEVLQEVLEDGLARRRLPQDDPLLATLAPTRVHQHDLQIHLA